MFLIAVVPLWTMHDEFKYCVNRRKDIPFSTAPVTMFVKNQQECQEACERDKECIGISFWEFSKMCVICLGDTLSLSVVGHSFHRKPGTFSIILG